MLTFCWCWTTIVDVVVTGAGALVDVGGGIGSVVEVDVVVDTVFLVVVGTDDDPWEFECVTSRTLGSSGCELDDATTATPTAPPATTATNAVRTNCALRAARRDRTERW
jgi:hypothetical protein